MLVWDVSIVIFGIAQLSGNRPMTGLNAAANHLPCDQDVEPSPSVGSNTLPFHRPPPPRRWRIAESTVMAMYNNAAAGKVKLQ